VNQEISSIFSKRMISGRVDNGANPNGIGYYLGNGSLYTPDYLNVNSEHRLRFHDMSDWIANVLNNYGTILDIGGGPGHLGYWMEKKHPGITVINSDFSFEALKEGLKNYPHMNVNLLAQQLPFRNDSFEGLLFGDILEHLTPKQAEDSLKEAYRVLKPAGYIFINIPNRISWTRKVFEEPTHLWIPTIRDMVEALTSISFKDIHTSTRGFPFSKKLRGIIGRDLHLHRLGKSIFIRAIKSS